jgi:hypothetical protein
VNASAELEVARHLESGESLLWAGVPRQGIFLRGADAFMIPFSFLWGGFAIFWEATAIAGGAPFFFALFGIPFVVIGLYMIAGRFFVDAKIRKNTYYGLTDRRVVIISGLFSQTTNSLPLRTLHDISVQERGDRSGTVMFGRPHPFASMYAGMQWPGMSQHQAPSFEVIEDAKGVHDQVLGAQRSAG